MKSLIAFLRTWILAFPHPIYPKLCCLIISRNVSPKLLSINKNILEHDDKPIAAITTRQSSYYLDPGVLKHHLSGKMKENIYVYVKENLENQK